MKSMKNQTLELTMLALMPAVVLTFTSCSSTPVGQTTTAAHTVKNPMLLVEFLPMVNA